MNSLDTKHGCKIYAAYTHIILYTVSDSSIVFSKYLVNFQMKQTAFGQSKQVLISQWKNYSGITEIK